MSLTLNCAEEGETIDLHLVEIDGVTHAGWCVEHEYLWSEECSPPYPVYDLYEKYPANPPQRPFPTVVVKRRRTVTIRNGFTTTTMSGSCDPSFAGDYPRGKRHPKWALLCVGRTEHEYWADMSVPQIVGACCPTCAHLFAEVQRGDLTYSKSAGRWLQPGEARRVRTASALRPLLDTLSLVKLKWEAIRAGDCGEGEEEFAPAQ